MFAKYYFDECLKVNLFLSMEDAFNKIEVWRQDYNSYRPHSSLKGKTPKEAESFYKYQPEFSTLD
jgi:putative transposase